MNLCVSMCVTLIRAYGDNFNDSLTVRVQGVLCHLQVLTTLSDQLIFSP